MSETLNGMNVTRFNQSTARINKLAATLDSAQWAIGDELVTIVSYYKVQAEAIELVADAVTLDAATLRKYLGVALSWSKDERVAGVAWSVHRAIMNNDRELMREGLVMSDIIEARRVAKNAAGTISPAAQKLDQARHALPIATEYACPINEGDGWDIVVAELSNAVGIVESVLECVGNMASTFTGDRKALAAVVKRLGGVHALVAAHNALKTV